VVVTNSAAGISRSASVVIAYLISEEGMSFKEAFLTVRKCVFLFVS
jgi:protein-tyrosine phosphatase